MIPGLLPAAHDPGGKAFPLAPDVTGSAVFGGPLDCYRYRLERVWGADGLTCLAVMMNPSCADPMRDDRTIQGLTRKVRSWSAYTRLIICNTFAYRAMDQGRLAEVPDPVGPDNNAAIMYAAAEAHMILMAYGKPKIAALRQRGPSVARMLIQGGYRLHALRVSADGTPWHPLYIGDAVRPQPWQPKE